MLEYGVIIAGTIFSVLCSFATKRTLILLLSGLCNISFTSFWYYMGETTAVVMGSVSLLGMAVQALTPEKHLAATLQLRVGFALMLGVIGFFISYHSLFDILPLTAFIIARTGEAMSRPSSIRISYTFSGSLWLAFSIATQHTASIASNTLCVAMQLYNIHREMMETRQAASQKILQNI